MQAQALIADAQQRFSLEPVVLPDPNPDQVLIRTACSGVSVGTEFALIRNKISWGPYPLCTGYMGTGFIEKVGRGLRQKGVANVVGPLFRKHLENHKGYTKVSDHMFRLNLIPY